VEGWARWDRSDGAGRGGRGRLGRGGSWAWMAGRGVTGRRRATGEVSIEDEVEVVALARFVLAGRPPLWTAALGLSQGPTCARVFVS
jgi:hypothetical protein